VLSERDDGMSSRLAPSSRARRLALRYTIVAVVAVAAVVAALTLGRSAAPAAAPQTTSVVQRGTVTLVVSAAGTIQAAQTRGLSFSTSGTLTEVDVKAGDMATKGRVLARIDPTDAQATVTSAQTRVTDAQTAVDRAAAQAALPPCPTATPTHATPSSSASGHGGGGGGPSPTATSSSHGSTSAGGGGGGGGTGGGGGGTGGGSTPTCQQPGRTSTSDALLQAQQQLNNAELALTQAQTRLAGTTIVAPITGRVLSVAGRVGNTESPGGTGFIVLGDVSTIALNAQFSEADIGRLAVGQPASITLPGHTDPVTGKVSQIDPAGTISGRLVRYGVLVAFDTVPADLLLGSSATVLVTTARADDVLYVASSAVTGVKGDKASVTVRVNGKLASRDITIGLRGDQYTEVASGLNEGDTVVIAAA
jgi:multidrug efflux pump subunit AcrA (membrane-fusion protein)